MKSNIHEKFFCIVFIYFILGISLKVTLADVCGSKEGRLNQVTTDFVIPDYFPPDSNVLRALVDLGTYGTVNRCENLYGRASLIPACSAHDQCYQTAGATKGRCDEMLLHTWEGKCRDQYRNRRGSPDNAIRSACRTACIHFVKLMSEAQKVNDAGFCPSCIAWDANENVRNIPPDQRSGSIVSGRNGKCLFTDDYQFAGNVRVVPCDRGLDLGRRWQVRDDGSIVSGRNGKCLFTDDYRFAGNVRVVPCDRGLDLGRRWHYYE